MRVPRQVSIKTFVLSLAILILVSGSLLYIAAQTPTATFWISSGIYPSAPVYTVWREGSNYFAKNHNGEIKYSGTNASDVIMDAFNNMVTLANPITQTLYIKGAISISTPIIFNFSIVGSGEPTIIFDRITVTANVDGIIISGGASAASYFYGRLQGNEIHFTPSGYTHTAVKIRNIVHGTFDIGAIQFSSNLGAAGSIGLELLGEDAGCFFNTVTVNRIAGYDTAILLNATGSHPTAFVNANTFYDTDIEYLGSYGVRFSSGAGEISGNSFKAITASNLAGNEYAFFFDGTYGSAQQNALYYVSTLDVVNGTDIYVANNQHIAVFGGQLVNNVTTVAGGGRLVLTNVYGVLWNGTISFYP